MKSITINSHAKINIFLHILGKRQDGYHDLYTLFTKIGLHDTLKVTHSETQTITCDNPDIPTDEKNIISKVDKILKAEYGIKDNFTTQIEKRIPDGGGLGGGSSNAAAYLRAVLELTETDMSMSDQIKIMAAVGSDTAFFLYDTPMIGEGRGEILSKYGALPPCHVLLINPKIHVSTAKVFSSPNLKLTDKTEVTRILHAKKFEDYAHIMYNGLEQAVFSEYPEVALAKDVLFKNGADNAMMSGSGSTVFGLFRDKNKAENALAAINNDHTAWKSFLTGII